MVTGVVTLESEEDPLSAAGAVGCPFSKVRPLHPTVVGVAGDQTAIAAAVPTLCFPRDAVTIRDVIYSAAE